jgi:hypothetical protein
MAKRFWFSPFRLTRSSHFSVPHFLYFTSSCAVNNLFVQRYLVQIAPLKFLYLFSGRCVGEIFYTPESFPPSEGAFLLAWHIVGTLLTFYVRRSLCELRVGTGWVIGEWRVRAGIGEVSVFVYEDRCPFSKSRHHRNWSWEMFQGVVWTLKC